MKTRSIEALNEAKEHIRRASARFRLRCPSIHAQLEAFGQPPANESEPDTLTDNPIPEIEE